MRSAVLQHLVEQIPNAVLKSSTGIMEESPQRINAFRLPMAIRSFPFLHVGLLLFTEMNTVCYLQSKIYHIRKPPLFNVSYHSKIGALVLGFASWEGEVNGRKCVVVCSNIPLSDANV